MKAFGLTSMETTTTMMMMMMTTCQTRTVTSTPLSARAALTAQKPDILAKNFINQIRSCRGFNVPNEGVMGRSCPSTSLAAKTTERVLIKSHMFVMDADRTAPVELLGKGGVTDRTAPVELLGKGGVTPQQTVTSPQTPHNFSACSCF
jgi:hypothetical protein